MVVGVLSISETADLAWIFQQNSLQTQNDVKMENNI